MKFGVFLTALFLIPGCIDAQILSKLEDNSLLITENPVFQMNFSIFETETQTGSSNKSPLKAVLLSGLLPGAGQWYAGNKLKALGFVAAEITLWLGNGYYDNLGAKIEADFIRYADLYWNSTDYFAWTNSPGVDVKTQYSHTLPGTKTQQYYEMVGKYDQFLAGWQDSTGPPNESPMRLHYMDMQHESNKRYKRADRFAQLLVVNRLVSAVEAAFSLRQKHSGVSAKLRWRYSSSTGDISPVASFSYVW